AVHDREPPVAPAFEFLAELPAVAEEAQVAADANGLVLDEGQAVVARRGRASEDTLTDTVDGRFLQGVTAECKQQQAHPRPAIRRVGGTWWGSSPSKSAILTGLIQSACQKCSSQRARPISATPGHRSSRRERQLHKSMRNSIRTFWSGLVLDSSNAASASSFR